MAVPIGDGYGQLLRPGGVTPLASGVQSAPDPMPGALANLGQAIEQRVKPILVDRAAREGERAGAAGVPESRTIWTDMDAAYMSAARQAYLARTATDRDDMLDQLFVDYQANPEGFELAARTAQQEAVRGSSPEFAVDLEQGWERGIQRRTQRLRIAKRDLDSRRARDDVDARVRTVMGTLEAAARNGTLGSEEAVEAMEEYNRLIDEKVANPVWGYTAAEAARDRQVFGARLVSLEIGKTVVTQFEANIASGMTARQANAAARADLARAFEQNPALAALPEAERQRLFGVADNALNESLAVRVAERQAQEEEARNQERETRERQESNYGRLLLPADNGTLTEAEINAALARGDISPTQADTLRGQTRAAAERAYRDRRRDEADADRAAAERRRADADADRAAAERERERGRAARDRAQSRVYELQDLAAVDPDKAVRDARRDYQNGVITEAQFRSIQSRAQSENNSDDSRRTDTIRSEMRSRRARPEEIDSVVAGYRNWVDQNPNASAAEREGAARNVVAGWERRRGERAAPGGRTRSVAQIDADIDRVSRDRSLSAAERARRLNALQNERRAALAAQRSR